MQSTSAIVRRHLGRRCLHHQRVVLSRAARKNEAVTRDNFRLVDVVEKDEAVVEDDGVLVCETLALSVDPYMVSTIFCLPFFSIHISDSSRLFRPASGADSFLMARESIMSTRSRLTSR